MKEALKEAKKAYNKKEVPIGSVIVLNGEIISRGHNLVESKNDPSLHSELIAIKRAVEELNSWRLIDCELYTTLEPCMMCTGAIVNSRIKKVYIGALDEKRGFIISKFNGLDLDFLNHKVEYEYGLLKEECSGIISDFFKELRDDKKNS